MTDQNPVDIGQISPATVDPAEISGIFYLQGLSRRGFVSSALVAGLATAFGLSISTDVAHAAGSYLRPCGEVYISDSWQGHKNRTPPSGEPGTDYAVNVGTPVHAASDGVIRLVKTTTSSATGRIVGMAHDDGNYTRHLHLSSVAVAQGQRVSRGQLIAYSGASANGSDRGVGAHVHTSLWLNTGSPTDFAGTVDFENYVGSAPTPIPDKESDEVFIANVAGSWYLIVPQGSGKPRGIVLGGDSNAGNSGLPVLNFTWGPSVTALRAAVDGV